MLNLSTCHSALYFHVGDKYGDNEVGNAYCSAIRR